MSKTRVDFPNQKGQTLSGLLEMPNFGEPIAYVLMAHSFAQTKRTKAGTYISRALRKEGFAILRFDFSGLGQSGGDFANTNFSTNVNDIIAAANFLRKDYRAPQILIGHSLGGTAVIEAAGDIPECVAVSTIGSPADPVHVTHLFEDQIENIMENGFAEVRLSGQDITIKKQFVDDLKSQQIQKSLHQLNRAFLAFHSPFDEIVHIEEAKSLYEAALHPKSFVSLDHANHMLTDRRDAEYVGSVLAAWALRYLRSEVNDEDDDDIELSKGEVASHIGKQKYLTTISSFDHQWIADEPKTLGGGNQGPTPYDLMAAALGACTSMNTIVKQSRVHAEDCEHCDKSEKYIHQFERILHIKGDLDAIQRNRLKEIANKCPVHRTLEGNIKSLTTLA